MAEENPNVEVVDKLFRDLNLSLDTTLSGARKIKAQSKIHFCAICLCRFANHKVLGKHVNTRKGHKADSDNITNEFTQANSSKATVDDESQQKYKLALLRKIALERFR